MPFFNTNKCFSAVIGKNVEELKNYGNRLVYRVSVQDPLLAPV